jgi:hypothetical protein
VAGIDRDVREGRALSAEFGATSDRMAEKDRVVGDVAAGRLTLSEAAARFRELNRAEPAAVRDARRATYPAGSEDERCCREVIGWMRGWLRDHPEADGGVSGRLEAELAGRQPPCGLESH